MSLLLIDNGRARILLVDANARVGSLTSQAIGSHQASEENAHGAMMHQWIVDHHMFVPQTMAEHHEGEAATFAHATGVAGRIDFVLLDECFRHPDLRTSVLDIDLAVQRPDHYAVAADVPMHFWHCSHRQRISSRKKVTNAASDTTPIIVPWSTDVHSHAAQLHAWLQRCQPRKPRLPRKRHLQDATWHLIQNKAFHWKRARQIRQTLRAATLRCIFQGWRNVRTLQSSSTSNSWLKQSHFDLAWHLHRYQQLCPIVAKRVRQDDTDYYQAFAQRHSDESLPTLWKTLKPVLPRASAKRASNLRCVGPATTDIVQHFDALEAGESASYPNLLHACHCAQQDALADAPLVVPLADLPSRIDIERLCCRAKRGKAPGIDQVTSETLQTCALAASDVLHQLLLKAFVQGAEPLQWKGGKMHVIPKKTNVLRADAMRGIMLLTSCGKLYHAMLRKMLIGWTTSMKVPAQMGGFQGQQTSFATHLLRTFCSLAVGAQMSIGVLFFDVKAAFHNMLREHAFGGSMLPARLCEVLTDAGLEVSQLCSDIATHSTRFATMPNAVLQRAVRDAHNFTWYVVDGHSECHQTHRGSRPGSPLADIAYNITMMNVLNDILPFLHQCGPMNAAAAHLPVRSPLVTWVDDLAIPVPVLHASELDDQIIAVLGEVRRILMSYGLQLNMQAGKTELVCQYHGKDAVACRHRRFVEHVGRLALPDGTSLHVVSQYQHLGTMFSQSMSLKSELDGRIGKAAAAFRQMSKPIFNNKKLAPALRLQLLESLVLSIVFYGSGTWPLLNHRMYAKLAHVVVKWQRQIAADGYWRDDRTADHDFQARWQLPVLSARLAKHRLLYAFKMVQHAPQDLITCVTAEDESDGGSPWCLASRHAIDWMRLQDPHNFAHAPVDTPATLIQWLHDHRHDGPHLVRRLARRATKQDHLVLELKQKTRQIYDAYRLQGVVFDQLPEEPLTASTTMFTCGICGLGFGSVQGLQAHRWRKHQIFSEERRYVYDTTCRACNRCFWTTQRLQQHLRWSRQHPHGCFYVMQRYFQPLEAPAQCAVPEFAQGFSRLPASTVEGPLPDVMPTVWQTQQQARRDHLNKRWQMLGYPDELPDEFQQTVYDLCTATTMNWLRTTSLEDLCDDHLMHQWLAALDDFSANDADKVNLATWAFFLWGQFVLPDLIERTEDPDFQICMDRAFFDLAKMFEMGDLLNEFDKVQRAREPLEPLLDPPVVTTDSRQKVLLEPFSTSYFDQPSLLQSVMPPVLTWPAASAVPVVLGYHDKPTLFVLHMFSGRRRDFDCHYWVEALAPTMLPEYHVVSLSMDTAIDHQLGNLLEGASLDHAVSLARGHAFALGLTGPPCETWTAARHIVCDELHGRGPRPLRSCLQAWGLPGLSMRELCQLGTGSSLMLHSLLLEVLIVLAGGGSIMEHPALPDNEDYASIWRTLLHRFLIMRAPLAQLVRIEQWRYGAMSVKPTILRGIGLPKLAQHLHACRKADLKRPTAVLSGYDAAKKCFRTAAAKEYPAGLCEALVKSSFQSLRLRLKTAGSKDVQWQQLDPNARTWAQALAQQSAVSFSSTFLPDYQPV